MRSYGVAFSPDGTRLATASWMDGQGVGRRFGPGGAHPVRPHRGGHWRGLQPRWDAPGHGQPGSDGQGVGRRSGQEVLTLSGHTNAVSGVAFSPDGTRLATASADQTAKVWDVASGQEVLTLPATPIRSMAWPSAPMGHAWPRPAGIRRRRCGTSLGPRSAHPVRPHRLGLWRGLQPRWDTPGHGQRDRTVRVYTLNIEDLMALVRRRITRSLTSPGVPEVSARRGRMSAAGNA